MFNLAKAYAKERRAGWLAKEAIRNARTRKEWNDLDGFVAEYNDDDAPDDYSRGPVRLRIVPDDYYDDSYLDTWTDIRESERERIRKELWRRIESDGAWGVIGEYWNGDEWESVDSCSGFVGEDWHNSGYDTDIMHATISAYNNHIEQSARALEATRPDMYA